MCVCASCSCTCVFMSVYSYVSERCVSDFPRLALYLCMKNDQNRSTSMLYLRSKHMDDWAASPLSSTTEAEACVCVRSVNENEIWYQCARVSVSAPQPLNVYVRVKYVVNVSKCVCVFVRVCVRMYVCKPPGAGGYCI